MSFFKWGLLNFNEGLKTVILIKRDPSHLPSSWWWFPYPTLIWMVSSTRLQLRLKCYVDTNMNGLNSQFVDTRFWMGCSSRVWVKKVSAERVLRDEIIQTNRNCFMPWKLLFVSHKDPSLYTYSNGGCKIKMHNFSVEQNT